MRLVKDAVVTCGEGENRPEGHSVDVFFDVNGKGENTKVTYTVYVPGEGEILEESLDFNKYNEATIARELWDYETHGDAYSFYGSDEDLERLVKLWEKYRTPYESVCV